MKPTKCVVCVCVCVLFAVHTFSKKNFQRVENTVMNNSTVVNLQRLLLGEGNVPLVLLNFKEKRRGKWTEEEEYVALTILQQYDNGTLAVPNGTTLSSCYEVAFNGDVMRTAYAVKKKFASKKPFFVQISRSVHEVIRIMKNS